MTNVLPTSYEIANESSDDQSAYLCSWATRKRPDSSSQQVEKNHNVIADTSGFAQEDENSKGQQESTAKKKTPMCLINELARHHKLQPQYRLTEESGPAHQKTFVVNLLLGGEEYVASGQSIKKAQHAAAQMALQNTSFRLPEPKPKAKQQGGCPQSNKPITPTVELNALAMKLNLPPVYTNLAPVPQHQQSETFAYHGKDSLPAPLSRGDFRLNQVAQSGRFLNADFQPSPFVRSSAKPPINQRYCYNRVPPTPVTHRVSLAVGKVVVTGEGPSPQAARHNAARQALEQLKNEALSTASHQNDDAALISEASANSDLKSPVSLAHELALKLNQTVEFSVLSESGPPHMKNFVVQCKLGELSTQGEGNCKKVAKKKAAELMLEELKKTHPNRIVKPTECLNSVQPRLRPKPKPTVSRKKPRNLVKEATQTNGAGTSGLRPQDPISQLVQLQQARKEKEPTFVVISEKGIPRQPEFIVQVTLGSLTATGVGPKKKDAKRAAALKALEALGINTEGRSVSSDIRPENEPNLVNGRQMIPGLLFVGQGKKAEDSPSAPEHVVKDTLCTSAGSKNVSKSSGGLRPEVSLRYLAQVLECDVEFSDFPKGKKGEYVSLVTLSTVPPQVCHGLGSTLEEARDNAAANMLKMIKIPDSNLDSTSCNKENNLETTAD